MEQSVLWLLILFGSLVIVLLSGIPVAFGIGVIVMAFMFFVWGPASFLVCTGTVFESMSAHSLVGVPLFILMAELIIHSGAGRDAFDAFNKWLGWLPGGLGIAAEFASALTAAVIGISTGNAAIIGLVAIPEMERHGYSPKLSAGSIAAGGTLGILIPPSVTAIIFGTIAQISVGKLFLAGILPGVVMAVVFSLYIFSYAVIKPSAAPRPPSFTFAERLKSIVKLLPLLLLAVFMMITLYGGIATPSEIGAMGVIFSFGLLFYYRNLKWEVIWPALLGTVKVTCMILWIIVTAACFGHIVSYVGAQQVIVDSLLGLSSSNFMTIVIMVLILLVLGMFLNAATMIVIMVPIYLPVVQAMGFDLIWFGVVFIVAMEMAYITPPFGMNLFIMRTIAPDISMRDVIIGVLPFVICQFLIVILLLLFPDMALIIPNSMMT